MKPLSRSRTGEQLNDILQTEIIFISGILTRIQKKMTKISTRTAEKKNKQTSCIAYYFTKVGIILQLSTPV